VLAASGGQPGKIAVTALAASGVAREVVETAGALLPTDVRRACPGARVIADDDVKALLGLEQRQQMMACRTDSPSCMAEIGGALGVDEVVAGRIGRLGTKLVLELRRIEVRKARVAASATRTMTSEDGLIEAIPSAVAEIYAGVCAPAEARTAPAAGQAAPVPPSPAAPQRPADEPADASRLVSGRPVVATVPLKTTELKPAWEAARGAVLGCGLAVGEEKAGSWEGRLVTAWRALDRGRRVRVELTMSLDGPWAKVAWSTEACSGGGCQAAGDFSERELALVRQVEASLSRALGFRLP
jgi:hypothetical protein